jgi:dCMP deaminase
MSKWDNRFLALAEHVAGWSKDPSTQVGAVIVDGDRQVLGIGYNGFPRDVGDTAERLNNRDMKLAMVVHAEVNAIVSSTGNLRGATLYCWPFMSCSSCTGVIIQAGIKRVVAPLGDAERLDRWWPSFLMSAQMFLEAGVEAEVMLPEGDLRGFMPAMRRVQHRNTLTRVNPPASEHHNV